MTASPSGYTHARTHETRRVTLPVHTFLARFLQHVLPRGFTKIRSYGLLSPTSRTDLERARAVLDLHVAEPPHHPATFGETPPPGSALHDTGDRTAAVPLAPASITVGLRVTSPAARSCLVCAHGALRLVERSRRSRAPPW